MDIGPAPHFQTIVVQLFAHPGVRDSQDDETAMREIDVFERQLVSLIEKFNRGDGGDFSNAPVVRVVAWRKDG